MLTKILHFFSTAMSGSSAHLAGAREFPRTLSKSAYLQELGLSFLPVQKLLKKSTWARRYSRSKLDTFWKNRDLSQDLSQIWEVGSPEVTQLGQEWKKNFEHGFSRSSEGVRSSYLNPVMFRKYVVLNNFSFWKFCLRFEKSGLTF